MNRITVKTNGKIPFISALLIAQKIELRKVTDCPDGCVFSIRRQDRKRCEETLKRVGKEYKVVSDDSFSALKKRALTRTGLIVGSLIFVAVVFLYSMTITRINVSGNDLVSEETIVETVLRETSFPTVKERVDVKKIGDAVSLIKGISDASVKIEGNTVFITVLEELSPVIFDSGDVTSKYDASVTKIVVYDGEACVHNGDAIKEGDVLLKADQNGVARGEVYGRIWLNEQIVVTPERMVTYRTGRKKTVYSLVGIEERYKTDYTLYEKIEREVWMPLAVPMKFKEIIVTMKYGMKSTNRQKSVGMTQNLNCRSSSMTVAVTF